MESNKTINTAAEIAETTFRLLSNCQQKEERLARQFEISVPEFKTLRMFRSGTQMHIKQLVEDLGLSGSRLTRILDSLEERGLITRSIDLHDRRSILVTLTAPGRALASQLEERYVQMHQQILDGIPEELHSVVLISLKKLLTSLEHWLHQTPERQDPVASAKPFQ